MPPGPGYVAQLDRAALDAVVDGARCDGAVTGARVVGLGAVCVEVFSDERVAAGVVVAEAVCAPCVGAD